MFRTRFAPSPTGYLHLGHAFSALTVFQQAREAGGEMLLRIEDTDFTRCRSEFQVAIFDDLQWLGLDWPEPVRRQSDQFEEYRTTLDKLIRMGVVYRCFRSRKEIMAIITKDPAMRADGPDGPVYFGTALPAADEQALIEQGKAFAWRLDMRAAQDILGETWEELNYTEENPDGPACIRKAKPEIFGDAVIARKDIGTSYHLASVHDDALQGITHVIRGDDLKQAAHLHRLLQALLDLPTPVYRHHRLVTDDTDQKLSKRKQSPSLKVMREAGKTADDIRRMLSDYFSA